MTNYKHYSWSAINRFSVQFLGFIGNVLIARLLTPDDYGLVAMLSILIGVAWNLTESGFADSLIRKKNPDKIDYSTIFIYNISISILLYFILYFLAPYVALFFNRKELIEITHILGLTIIIKSFTLTEFTRMRKELMFKNTAIIQVLSSLLSIIVAYFFALKGYSYWALLLQTLSLGFFNLFFIVIINKWRPCFQFSWSKFKELRTFSNNMLLSYFMNQIGYNLYSVFIGKFQPTNELGFYNQAIKINDASFQGVNSVILTTSFSIAANEHDRNKRSEMYKKILRHFIFVHFFISFFIIGSSHFLVKFIFGEKWIDTAPFLTLLSISFLLYPLTTINSNILKTENRSDIYKNLTFIRNGLLFVSLMFTFKYSITIILYGMIIARYISVAIDVFSSGKLIDFTPVQQFKIVFEKSYIPIISMMLANIFSVFWDDCFERFFIFSSIYFLIFIIGNFLKKDEIQNYYLDFLLKFIKK